MGTVVVPVMVWFCCATITTTKDTTIQVKSKIETIDTTTNKPPVTKWTPQR